MAADVRRVQSRDVNDRVGAGDTGLDRAALAHVGDDIRRVARNDVESTGRDAGVAELPNHLATELAGASGDEDEPGGQRSLTSWPNRERGGDMDSRPANDSNDICVPRNS